MGRWCFLREDSIMWCVFGERWKQESDFMETVADIYVENYLHDGKGG